MARVKRAVHAKKHHRAVLEQAQGYYGNKSRSFRAANEQVMHSMQYAYRDRRARKGDFRQLWIQRINAAARLNGTSYSRFIAGLHRADVDVDRKVLADLAVTEPEVFASLVQVANDALAEAPATCRGRFLSQVGLSFTHQRVRRVRQLLRKRSLRSAEAAWSWKVPNCCPWRSMPAPRSSRSMSRRRAGPAPAWPAWWTVPSRPGYGSSIWHRGHRADLRHRHPPAGAGCGRIPPRCPRGPSGRFDGDGAGRRPGSR